MPNSCSSFPCRLEWCSCWVSCRRLFCSSKTGTSSRAASLHLSRALTSLASSLCRLDMSDSTESRRARELKRRKILRLIVFALFLLYPAVSSQVLSFFICRDVAGVSYLVADFSLECHTP